MKDKVFLGITKAVYEAVTNKKSQIDATSLWKCVSDRNCIGQVVWEAKQYIEEQLPGITIEFSCDTEDVITFTLSGELSTDTAFVWIKQKIKNRKGHVTFHQLRVFYARLIETKITFFQFVKQLFDVFIQKREILSISIDKSHQKIHVNYY